MATHLCTHFSRMDCTMQQVNFTNTTGSWHHLLVNGIRLQKIWAEKMETVKLSISITRGSRTQLLNPQHRLHRSALGSMSPHHCSSQFPPPPGHVTFHCLLASNRMVEGQIACRESGVVTSMVVAALYMQGNQSRPHHLQCMDCRLDQCISAPRWYLTTKIHQQLHFLLAMLTSKYAI